jgi:WD40 repeat protein
VWDIEDGQLMSRFIGHDKGHKIKITAGCFDSTQRRLITASGDGTMWNFSNGQPLTELLSKATGRKIDTEITELVCVYDEEDIAKPIEDQTAISKIVAVGWDKKVYIWNDDKEEEVETSKILP